MGNGFSVSALAGKRQYMEPMVVAGLLSEYGAPEYVIAEAKAKCKQIRQGSPNQWRDTGPTWFNRLIQLEPLATTIDIFEDIYVTGLMQTKEYARAVMEAGGLLTLKQIDAALDLRARRREAVLNRDNPARVRVIQTEYSLEMIKGSELYDDQIQRIKEDNERPDVEIYLLPMRGFHPSMNGSYVVMSFDETTDRDMGYHEGPFGAHYEATKTEVDRVRDIFSDTLALSERLK
jgi:hypothetical protein